MNTRTAATDFSLVLDAPASRLWRRLQLADGKPRAALRLMALAALVTWAPLLLLSISEGSAGWGSVALPFLYEIEVHVRLLIAVPVLLLADGIVHRRLRSVALQFVERRLVPDAGIGQFEAALATVARLRSSRLAELLIVGLVYGGGVLLLWRTQVALDVPSWYGVPKDGQLQPSRAGWWFGLVSLPIFQFLLFRWFYRQLIWGVFLWKVSRIELEFMPKHPDRAGGIGFLAQASYAFAPILVAQSAALAGTFANRIFYTGASLAEFYVDIAGLVGLMLVIVFAPLLFFSRKLEAAKREGLQEYGRLAERYVREFDAKWLRDGRVRDEPLVGSPDIQSLADLDQAYDVVKGMRLVPFSLQNLVHMAASTLVPLLPLMLTMFPAEVLFDQMLKILF